ncbi:MAG TPA: trypsin-like peptidase domain-containing protein [Spirochaetia bacterium]|nr:trypsin-like peptidase domain-containing protein [Spirochaetia bacterium]
MKSPIFPIVPIVLSALVLTACPSTPPTPEAPPLPEVRIKEIQDLTSSGSFLQSLQEISWLRREKEGEVPAADLDTLQTGAVNALSSAFMKAVDEKKYGDALRYFNSAAAMGMPSITGAWTERSILGNRAESEHASGNDVVALVDRLQAVSLPGSTPEDVSAAYDVAARLGNRAVVRHLIDVMKKRGMAVPAAAASMTDAAPSFPQMLTGTVTILVDRGIRVQNGVGYPDQIIGSGFFIDSRGYILTNHHVIKSEVDPKDKGYSRLYIRLSESPAGERIPAKVIGYDPIFDLALIKTELTAAFTFGGFGAETVAPGERIYAIGSPAGLEKTITSGIVSAMGRHLLQMGDVMQVDVPLNPGNSGGPLLNEKGDLVGVGFAGLEQFQGLNFAVPYRWIEKVIPALYNGGEAVHPWLGIALAETDKGLEVVYSVPGEPGAQAGIKAGDVIDTVDGEHFAKIQEVQEALLAHSPPTLVRVAFHRGTKALEGVLCLASRPERPIEVALKRDTRDNVLYPLFGMKLEKVGSFFWSNDYVVRRVTRGSVADQSGLSENDPLSIQDWKVDTDKGFAALLLVIKKRKAGFIESAVQIAADLETDNFI